MENKILITQAENGIIITEYHWEKDDKQGNPIIKTYQTIIEDKYNSEDDLTKEQNTLKDLIERISEWYGYEYDKFGKENIEISFTKRGHKHYDETEGEDDSTE